MAAEDSNHKEPDKELNIPEALAKAQEIINNNQEVMLTQIAHQMRNSISSISLSATRLNKKDGFARILIRRILDPNYRKYTGIIIEEIEKIESVLNKLSM